MDLEPHFEEPEEKMEMDAGEDHQDQDQDQDLDIDVDTEPGAAKEGNEDNVITIDDDELLDGDDQREEELGYESNQDDDDDVSVEKHVEEIESSSEEELEQKLHLIKSYPIIVSKDDMDGSFFLFSCYESEDAEDAPVLLDEVNALNMPMEDIFGSLRQAFEKFGLHISLEDELIFYFPQMELRIQEDNFYSKEVTMNDIFEVFCELVSRTPDQEKPVALDVQLQLNRRFIAVFNALSERIREGKGFPDISLDLYEERGNEETLSGELETKDQPAEHGDVKPEGQPRAAEPEVEDEPDVEVIEPEDTQPEIEETELQKVPEVEEVTNELDEEVVEAEEVVDVTDEPEVPEETEEAGATAGEAEKTANYTDEPEARENELENTVPEEIELATEEDAVKENVNGKEEQDTKGANNDAATAVPGNAEDASYEEKTSTTEGEAVSKESEADDNSELLASTNDLATEIAETTGTAEASAAETTSGSPTNKRPLDLAEESPQKKTKSD